MAVTMSGMRSSSTFGVSYGGTGNTSFTSGSILIGNDGEPLGEIPVGSEGQVLTVVSGAWVPANNAGGNGGGAGLSSIVTSGNLDGNGTAGDPAILKDDISLNSVTASFSGDGSEITGLISSQISDFDAAVDARLADIPNSALQNSSIIINGESVSLGGSVSIATSSADPTFTSVTAATGTISGDLTVNGNFYVNGSQTFVNSTDLAISDKVILIASGAANQAQLDGAGIHFGNVPSEDARVIYDSVNDWMEIYPSVSSSAYIGDGSGLTNLPDPTVKEFTAAGISVGQAVSLHGTLVPADKSHNLKSNVIGVAISVSGTSVVVKLVGEVSVNGASSYVDVGTPVYVGVSGSVVNYASLSTGDYVTQVGFISDTGKIIIQPRIFGQL